MTRYEIISRLRARWLENELSTEMILNMLKEGYITEHERDIILNGKDKGNDKP